MSKSNVCSQFFILKTETLRTHTHKGISLAVSPTPYKLNVVISFKAE